MLDERSARAAQPLSFIASSVEQPRQPRRLIGAFDRRNLSRKIFYGHRIVAMLLQKRVSYEVVRDVIATAVAITRCCEKSRDAGTTEAWPAKLFYPRHAQMVDKVGKDR